MEFTVSYHSRAVHPDTTFRVIVSLRGIPALRMNLQVASVVAAVFFLLLNLEPPLHGYDRVRGGKTLGADLQRLPLNIHCGLDA